MSVCVSLIRETVYTDGDKTQSIEANDERLGLTASEEIDNDNGDASTTSL